MAERSHHTLSAVLYKQKVEFIGGLSHTETEGGPTRSRLGTDGSSRRGLPGTVCIYLGWELCHRLECAGLELQSLSPAEPALH